MFTNIVWATDGSAHADRALQYALRLAETQGATLHAAHVVEKLVGLRVAGQNSHLDETEIDAKIQAQCQQARGRGIDIQLHMTPGRTGEIATRIADIAAEVDADLIIVGTRGHSAAVGAIIGSVTQRLLHLGYCPVLAVPPARAGAGFPATDGAGVAVAAR